MEGRGGRPTSFTQNNTCPKMLTYIIAYMYIHVRSSKYSIPCNGAVVFTFHMEGLDGEHRYHMAGNFGGC